MAKLVRTFQGGKMNKDLDERLIPNGEYRDAMNIEITTSDDSDVGTVQHVRGNKEIPSYSISDPVNPTFSWNHSSVFDGSSKVVASIADDKSNSCYFFIAAPEYSEMQYNIEEQKVFKDMIIRYDSVTKKLYPVLTDIIRVETPNVFSGISSDFDHIVVDSNFDTDLIRPGMLVKGMSGNIDVLQKAENYVSNGETGYGAVIVREVIDNKIYFDRKVSHLTNEIFGGVEISSVIQRWTFTHPEPVLQFSQGLQKAGEHGENYIITGINVIDNLLFWTDGYSEPKKVNIDRLINGINENAPHFSKHSLNLLKDPYSSNPNVLKTLSQLEDPTNVGLGVHNGITRDHITVIRKSPTTAPKLIMSNSISSLDGVATLANCFHDFVNIYESQTASGVSISESFIVGSTLVLTPLNNIYASIRAVIVSNNDGEYVLDIESISSAITNAQVGEYVNYKVQLVQTDPIFKDQIGRFSYRYKYYDNECSSFAPWSEIAFLPSKYDYTPIKGYNLGMSNNLRSLRVVDFVNEYGSRPDDIKEIDILFKDTTSPNVYVVKTIKRGKNFEWQNVLGSSSGTKGSGAKGVVNVTTEMIHRTLESSQMLRAWDNVPITAKAQEVTGSRIVYANYEQGYNIYSDITVDAKAISSSHPGEIDEANQLLPYKSLKSMRKYKLGVVFGDKYGRETPVVGLGGAYEDDFYVDPLTLDSNSDAENYVPESFGVKKDKSASINQIKAQLKWGNSMPEEWMHYYKFYIKETSNEYYNLVMDRWYDNGDGTIWLSFASADRNKVSKDTYLILKKGQDTQAPVLSDDGKYKILAISNEAPDYIKTVNKIIGVSPLDVAGNANLSSLMSAQIVGDSWVGSGLGAIASGSRNFEGVGWARIKGICENATPSEILYSEWRRISNINDQTSSISVIEPWGDRADMQSDYGFGSGADVDYFVEVKDAVIENKPEFNGKFFVKIFKDSLLEQSVTISSGSDIMYSADLIADVGYIYTGSNYGLLTNPADSNALYKGDYSTITTPTPINGVNDYSDYSWGYTGFSGGGNSSVPNMYNNGLAGCGIINNAGYPIYDYNIIRDYWEDYWTGSTYGANTANRWFIDHASYVKASGGSTAGEWDEAYMQGIFHTSAEEFAPLLVLGGLGDNFNVDVGAGSNISAGIVPQNKNTIVFSHVGTGYGAPDMAFKDRMTTLGQKFRFKGDPGLEGDPIIYEVWAVIPNVKKHSYKGQGSYGPSNNDPDTYCQGCVEEGPGSSFACMRTSFIIFFKQAANDYQGLDTSVWDPRSLVKHDGSNSLKIELVTAADTSQYISSVTNTDNAIFETEPKEDIDVDLYYEASDAIPLKLDGKSIESYIPLYSEVSPFIPDMSGEYTDTVLYSEYSWDKIYVSSAVRDVVGLGISPGAISPIPLRLNGKLEFLRPDGTITEGRIIDHWQPIRKSSNTIGSNAATASYGPATKYTNVEMYLTSGPNDTRKLVIPQVSSSGVDQLEIITDIIDGFNPEFEANHIWKIEDVSVDQLLIGDTYIYNRDYQVNEIDLPNPGLSLLCNFLNNTELDITGVNSLNGFLLAPESSDPTIFTVSLQKITGFYRLSSRIHENSMVLPWFNCYSFGNGLESNRIKDDFNAPFINNGFKVSTTLDSYGKEIKTNGLIHSGIYNSIGGVNKLNEFNMAEPITKSVNPSYGPIRVLKSRDTNLVTFCEDKVLQILANKDALFNADGTANLISTNAVLGNTKTFAGDYGISNSPESLAVDGYRMYFVDKHRNKVLRLSQDGLTIISDIGMKKFFRDNLKNCKSVVGTFDEVKGDYNISIIYQPVGFYGVKDKTVSFNERNKGWTSFKSFVLESGISINSDYLSGKQGGIYLHHVMNNGEEDPNPGEFYGVKEDASITMIFNDHPSIVKNFKAIGYEGSKPKINEFVTATAVDANMNTISNNGLNSLISDGQYDNLVEQDGWYVDYINTDLESANAMHFKNKEGKWFSDLIGVTLDPDDLDLSQLGTQNFTIQGIGVPKALDAEAIKGCMCPDSVNYNPLAEVDDPDAPCNNTGIVYGCTDANYLEYNASATHRKTSCTDFTDPCLNHHIYGCSMELNAAGTRRPGVAAYSGFTVAYNENPHATMDDGSCLPVVLGCIDPSSPSYNPSANTDDPDNPCVHPIYGCMDNHPAANYNPDATWQAIGYHHDAGGYYGNPCVYTGCTDDAALNYIGTIDGSEWVPTATFKISKAVNFLNNITLQYDYYPASFHDEDDCDLSVIGCTDPGALNYNPNADIACNENGTDNDCCNYQGTTRILMDEI